VAGFGASVAVTGASDPAVGSLAGFASPAYRFTVPRCTSSLRAIRRFDQPCCANALIVCSKLTLSWFIAPVATLGGIA